MIHHQIFDILLRAVELMEALLMVRELNPPGMISCLVISMEE